MSLHIVKSDYQECKDILDELLKDQGGFITPGSLDEYLLGNSDSDISEERIKEIVAELLVLPEYLEIESHPNEKCNNKKCKYCRMEE